MLVLATGNSLEVFKFLHFPFISIVNGIPIGYPIDIALFKYIRWISIGVEIRLKLRKVGNSVMIAIPSQVVSDLKLKPGDAMLLDVKDSKILIRKDSPQ